MVQKWSWGSKWWEETGGTFSWSFFHWTNPVKCSYPTQRDGTLWQNAASTISRSTACRQPGERHQRLFVTGSGENLEIWANTVFYSVLDEISSWIWSFDSEQHNINDLGPCPACHCEDCSQRLVHLRVASVRWVVGLPFSFLVASGGSFRDRLVTGTP